MAAWPLGSLLVPDLFKGSGNDSDALPLGIPHFAPKAKRVIYLFQNGAPSQYESFEYKPMLNKMAGEELPASIRMGQRLTGMTANQAKFPLVGSHFNFKQYGQSGMWFSELFPNIANLADNLCMIKTMNTDAINHDPALTFMQTGAQQGNRPSMGAWASYGLGSENKNLTCFFGAAFAWAKATDKGFIPNFGPMDFWIRPTKVWFLAVEKTQFCT